MDSYAHENSHPLRVMIVSSEYPPYLIGGLGTHVSELAKGLGRSGCKVDVLAPSAGETAVSAALQNVTANLISISDIINDPALSKYVEKVSAFNKRAVMYGRALIAKSSRRPDIIHCHDWLGFSTAYQLGRTFSIPVVATIHLLYEPIFKRWGQEIPGEIIREERNLCQNADRLISVSQSMRSIICSTHNVPKNLVHVVYNAFDVDLFMKSELDNEGCKALRQAYASTDEKLILFASRLAPQKGVAALVESAQKVLAANPKVRYLVAGKLEKHNADETRQYFETEFFKGSGIGSQFTFLGMVPREELASLYKIADIAIVPSIYEPFGYAATEAMAAGVPVVASNVGGLGEIILHGKTGLLVPVRPAGEELYKVNVNKLAEAQLTLLNDEAMARQLGEAGRQRVRNDFNIDQMIESTLSVYRQTVTEFKARARESVVNQA